MNYEPQALFQTEESLQEASLAKTSPWLAKGRALLESVARYSTKSPASPPNDTAGLQYGIRLRQSVRRLTPTECERLQGFPDGWTEGQADSHRYKQMGNAVAVPVVEWIVGNLVARDDT